MSSNGFLVGYRNPAARDQAAASGLSKPSGPTIAFLAPAAGSVEAAVLAGRGRSGQIGRGLAPGPAAPAVPSRPSWQAATREWLHHRDVERLARVGRTRQVLPSVQFGFKAAARYTPWLGAAVAAWGVYDVLSEGYALLTSGSGNDTVDPSNVTGAITFCTGAGSVGGALPGGTCEEVTTLFYEPVVDQGWWPAVGGGWVRYYHQLVGADVANPPYFQWQVTGIILAPEEFYPDDPPPIPNIIPGFVETPTHVGTEPKPLVELDPMLTAPQTFAPQTVPPPWRRLPQRVPNPMRSPNESTTRGPSPQLQRQLQPEAETAGSSGAGTPVTSTSRTNGRGPVRTRQDTHWRRPPRRGEKEVKVRRALTAASAIVRIAYGATELVDIIDAVYLALPRKIRRAAEYQDAPTRFYDRDGNRTRKLKLRPHEKLSLIYRNAAALDREKLAWNLLAMEVIDQSIGRIRGRLTPDPSVVVIGPHI